MKLIDGDKLKKHLDYLIQKEEQLAKKCSLSPDNEFERQRRYCFEANALAYELCKNVMDYYLVVDTQAVNQVNGYEFTRQLKEKIKASPNHTLSIHDALAYINFYGLRNLFNSTGDMRFVGQVAIDVLDQILSN